MRASADDGAMRDVSVPGRRAAEKPRFALGRGHLIPSPPRVRARTSFAATSVWHTHARVLSVTQLVYAARLRQRQDRA